VEGNIGSPGLRRALGQVRTTEVLKAQTRCYAKAVVELADGCTGLGADGIGVLNCILHEYACRLTNL
jgi:hypothetical protein